MTDYIHVSNGDGIPVTAIVTTDRGIGSTQLIVDSVLNWATHGIGMSGTLNPTNGEITEKTVFRYHLDGSIITIEKFTAGYIDIGNTADQIVVLKPTTEWGNAVADRVNEIEVGATWHSGAGAPSDSLGNDGDYYLNTTNSDIYTKTAGTWGGSILNIKGATGATGSAGTNGTNGAAGAVIRNGSGAPSNGLGIDGDYYINITTSDVYFKASGAYTIVVNIKGATGSTGSTGAAGKGVTSIVKTNTVGLVDTYTITYTDATTSTFTITNGTNGTNGTDGTDGTNGVNGSTWHSGSGVPSSGLGVDGDYYFRTDTGGIYNKASGAWSLTTTLSSTDTNAVHKADTSLVGNGFFLDEDTMTSNSDTKTASQQSIKAYIDAQITAAKTAMQIAVGDLHLSTSSTNPATSLGYGTWVAWGTGRVPVGVDTTQTEFNTVEKTGGDKLLQAHTHGPGSYNVYANAGAAQNTATNLDDFAGSGGPIYGTHQRVGGFEGTSGSTGGGAGQNLQPYITCYMWKRTA